MTEQARLYNSVAPLTNVSALVGLISRVVDRNHNLPGLAVFYGPSGYGKTTAATYAANHFDAYSVQMKSVWRPVKLCEAILLEMGLKPARGIANMVEQIGELLATSNRPLLIDEADFLTQHKMVELVRDIYETSGTPIILIGEEELPQKFQPWERFHNRVLDWVAAERAQRDELDHLARIYAPSITIESELLDRLMVGTRANIRRICENFDRMHEFSRARGLKTLTVKDWGEKDFFTGQAPAPRRGLK
ncbi:AAA family ATPase [Oceaniglobus trochenteri]|uniref:AAA family ATPase n=1 Tax=Oceaniglobus trochenteri TaxID=2763260 RepID=UPI001CFF8961|nr:ATP-binding protein [Oceaniglobus trochenteri]